MKTQLLFTAVLMAATGVVSHNVHAEKELSPQAVMATEGEGEGASGGEGIDEATVTLPETV